MTKFPCVSVCKNRTFCLIEFSRGTVTQNDLTLSWLHLDKPRGLSCPLLVVMAQLEELEAVAVFEIPLTVARGNLRRQ